MKNRRDQDEPGWPPWATILVVAILLGAFIWQIVPRHIIYLGIGVAIAIIGGVSYLVYKKRGMGVFKSGAKKIYESLKGGTRETRRPSDVVPPLSEEQKARLKLAVGYRCENPNCPSPGSPALDVHHIVPKNEEGSSNRLSNLLVLCKNCHSSAGHSMPSREVQKQLAGRLNRFTSDSDIERDWKYGR